ncbi:MAG: AraC family transcriptional regulator [Rariglobus sp.]|jgi:AraC-like DNA-binding protein|nr:AraC family transcriptional regulator [Rariglobus sp.]
MKRQKDPDLIRLTAVVRDPPDFYCGLRRRSEAAPDNLVLFVRRRRSELRPSDGSDSFHERWVLLVVLAGTGELRRDRQPLRLKPGVVVMVPPLHLHGYINVTPRIHWLFVTFEWPGHMASSEDWRGPRRLDAMGRRRLAAVMGHYLPPERDGVMAAAQLLELLRHLYPRTEPAPTSRHSLLTAVQAAAKESPGEKLPLLARRLGISESHLRTRFRREAGLSLGRYLREARLREAALWLREEGLSVTAAAERAKYPDVFTFSRAFRRVLGYPPSRVRNK